MSKEKLTEETTFSASVTMNDGAENKTASINTDNFEELERFLSLAGVKAPGNIGSDPTPSCGEGWADENPANMDAAGYETGGDAEEIEVMMPGRDMEEAMDTDHAEYDHGHVPERPRPYSMDVHDYQGRSETDTDRANFRRVNNYGDNALPKTEDNDYDGAMLDEIFRMTELAGISEYEGSAPEFEVGQKFNVPALGTTAVFVRKALKPGWAVVEINGKESPMKVADLEPIEENLSPISGHESGATQEDDADLMSIPGYKDLDEIAYGNRKLGSKADRKSNWMRGIDKDRIDAFLAGEIDKSELTDNDRESIQTMIGGMAGNMSTAYDDPRNAERMAKIKKLMALIRDDVEEGGGPTQRNRKEDEMLDRIDRKKSSQKFKPVPKNEPEDKYAAMAKKHGVGESDVDEARARGPNNREDTMMNRIAKKQEQGAMSKFKPKDEEEHEDKYAALAKKHGIKEEPTFEELEAEIAEELEAHLTEFGHRNPLDRVAQHSLKGELMLSMEEAIRWAGDVANAAQQVAEEFASKMGISSEHIKQFLMKEFGNMGRHDIMRSQTGRD